MGQQTHLLLALYSHRVDSTAQPVQNSSSPLKTQQDFSPFMQLWKSQKIIIFYANEFVKKNALYSQPQQLTPLLKNAILLTLHVLDNSFAEKPSVSKRERRNPRWPDNCDSPPFLPVHERTRATPKVLVVQLTPLSSPCNCKRLKALALFLLTRQLQKPPCHPALHAPIPTKPGNVRLAPRKLALRWPC